MDLILLLSTDLILDLSGISTYPVGDQCIEWCALQRSC